jgi:nucleoside-diphosphate-sugar epimerase
MRVFVAGATGVVGQFLVPGLIAAGHQVTGSTRSQAKAGPAYPSWRDGFPVWAKAFGAEHGHAA